MGTEYLVEIVGWDQGLHLGRSPGGIPEEHTFQGELIFVRHLEIEGRILAPSRHRDKRLRIWLSERWRPNAHADSVNDVGSLEARVSDDLGREFLVQLYAPESALEPAAVCLGTSWKCLRLKTGRMGRNGARVTDFSFSRSTRGAQ
jgi:hypothetical protein